MRALLSGGVLDGAEVETTDPPAPFIALMEKSEQAKIERMARDTGKLPDRASLPIQTFQLTKITNGIAHYSLLK